MTTHELKCWPEFFDAIEDGEKTFEVRLNDRGFQKGDVLSLGRWDHGCVTARRDGTYARLKLLVTYVLSGNGVRDGFVVMGIRLEDCAELERRIANLRASHDLPRLEDVATIARLREEIEAYVEGFDHAAAADEHPDGPRIAHVDGLRSALDLSQANIFAKMDAAVDAAQTRAVEALDADADNWCFTEDPRIDPPPGYEVWNFYEGSNNEPDGQAWLWRGVDMPDDDGGNEEDWTRAQAVAACWAHRDAVVRSVRPAAHERDESKPPPGWVHHAFGQVCSRGIHPMMSYAQAWALYDAEHGHSKGPSQ